jgi:hypothetical protein
MTENEQIAMEVLARNCQACLPPELDEADLESLLIGAQVATVWQPDTDYPPGAVIVPDSNSLQSYRATTGGTSGATPPAWPAAPFYGSGWSGNPTLLYPCCCSWAGGGGVPITDGTVTWVSAGVIAGLFDLTEATSSGWLLKCAKANALVQNSSAGQSLASQQLFEHCQRMAAHWQPYKAA